MFSREPKKRWTSDCKLDMEHSRRDVAQLGRALRSGRRSRAFKSRHPDHFLARCSDGRNPPHRFYEFYPAAEAI